MGSSEKQMFPRTKNFLLFLARGSIGHILGRVRRGARLDPSEAEQVSKARDDGGEEVRGVYGLFDLIRQIFAKALDLPHSAYARRAPFVAYATFPPFGGGIAPLWKGEKS